MEQEALGEVLGPLRKSQRSVIALVVEAISAPGQASSLNIAARLAQRTGAGVPSALVRFYRLLHKQIRDTKGARFGFALVWTQITTPEALSRFVLLIGLALMILTAVGHAVAQKYSNVRLPSKTKGPRLSLLTVGLLFWPSL
jgi:hypothetical protein